MLSPRVTSWTPALGAHVIPPLDILFVEVIESWLAGQVRAHDLANSRLVTPTLVLLLMFFRFPGFHQVNGTGVVLVLVYGNTVSAFIGPRVGQQSF